jgi:glycosyltransferase involved in cell wall biosynthesis
MVPPAPTTRPLVSVITPFYNTAPYLAQSIESVLAQSRPEFEYLLVDNCSTDGSTEIAASYAHRDPRIRFLRRSQFLSQLQNFNSALTEISADSEYCKLVLADDYIFPDCLRLMIEAFEQSETIGLVSSYCLKGSLVMGSGYPFPATILSGAEAARLYLRDGTFIFGSPTTVMYRSSMVRRQTPFYDESGLHADTEKCMELLQHCDFGFVPQILSFLRTDNESISSSSSTFEPFALDWYITMQRYAGKFFAEPEAAIRSLSAKRSYYQVLAKEALRFRGPEFWRYHEQGLETLGQTFDRSYLARQIALVLLWQAANPGRSAQIALRFLKGKMGWIPAAGGDGSASISVSEYQR